MKIASLVVMLCAVVVLATRGSSQNVFTPDQVKWGPPAPFIAQGAQLAVLEGDPTASSGEFHAPPEDAGRLQDRATLASQAGERDCDLGGNSKVGIGDKWGR